MKPTDMIIIRNPNIFDLLEKNDALLLSQRSIEASIHYQKKLKSFPQKIQNRHFSRQTGITDDQSLIKGFLI